ncbi:MAG TPA: ATP-binding protein [Acidimicrobiales bacterium]
MDKAETVVQYVNLVLFGALAIVCLRIARRHRTAAARWAALTFGTLGVVVAVGLVVPDKPEILSEVVTRVLVLGILVYPYALYRFSATFEQLPRLFDRVALVGTAALAVATVVLPEFPEEGEPRSALFGVYVLAFIGLWMTLSFVVARRLWRAGRGQPTVSRYRMRTLALGAIGLGLALLPGLEEADDQPVGVRIVTIVLPAASALLFYVGFAPPAPLRALWRRPEQAALRRIELDLIGAEDRERVLAAVLPHAAALVGGNSASYAEAGGESSGGLADRTVDGTVGVGVVRLPVGRGQVVVEAGPYAPFFGDEELEMLRSLGTFLGLVLERTELLEREREARDEAERTSKELETLVYGISHDLKSPIISLLGYLEYLRDDHGETIGEGGRHFLERMERSAVYMQDLLTDLLELSRVGRVNVEPAAVDLHELVEDVAVDVRSRFAAATVDVGELPPAWINPARARQLFINLIENAARHGGREDITIRISGREEPNGMVMVSVADDGVGVPPEYREKAFGIFERLTARDASSGTGIGLALCRKIVEYAGGEIAMIDAPTGTDVRITLPARAAIARRQPLEVST